MSFVNAHFITYVRDLGYHPMVAAGAFSLIGAAALIGALFLGHLSDIHGRRVWLSVSYHLRTLGFIVVLLSMGVFLPRNTVPRPDSLVDRRASGGLLLERGGFDNRSLRLRPVWRQQFGINLRDHVCGNALGLRSGCLLGRTALRLPGDLLTGLFGPISCFYLRPPCWFSPSGNGGR